MIGRGRALGPGRLFKRGKAWVLDFREAGGQRRHWTLGPDKRVAEARRLELIIQRNMELEGLGSREGRRRGLVEIAELYLADLRARVSPMHLKNLEIRLAHTLAALGERRAACGVWRVACGVWRVACGVSETRSPTTWCACAVRPRRPVSRTAPRTWLSRTASPLEPHDEPALTARQCCSSCTADLIVEANRAILNWAVETGLISESPLKRIKKLPEGKDHQRYKRRAPAPRSWGASSPRAQRTTAPLP